MSNRADVFCCVCNFRVSAKEFYGKDAYPHRPDLREKLFWQCGNCKNFVGSHEGNDEPLGVIVSSEVKKLRMQIHNIIDPLWKNKKIKRKRLYKIMSDFIGKPYHTANIGKVEEAEMILEFVRELDLKYNLLELSEGFEEVKE